MRRSGWTFVWYSLWWWRSGRRAAGPHPAGTERVDLRTSIARRRRVPFPLMAGLGRAALEVAGVVRTSGRQVARPIASLAKMMTAYIVLRRPPADGW